MEINIVSIYVTGLIIICIVSACASILISIYKALLRIEEGITNRIKELETESSTANKLQSKACSDEAAEKDKLISELKSDYDPMKRDLLLRTVQFNQIKTDLAAVKEERDAAVEDLEKAMPWWACKHKDDGVCSMSSFDGKHDCDYCGQWQWRGVREGEK